MLAARERAVAANEALQDAVDRARDAGHSWREIGEVLGTTRQAAFQRFAHRAGDDTMVDVPLHFEAGDGVGSIRFDHDGRVAGLMLRPAAPAPPVPPDPSL